LARDHKAHDSLLFTLSFELTKL